MNCVYKSACLRGALWIWCVFFIGAGAYAQAGEGVTLSGKIYNSVTGQPVDFGSVILLEGKAKAYADTEGSYSVAAPAEGDYTVLVQSEGLKTLQTKISLNAATVRDFYLDPLEYIPGGITVMGERDIQKVSRYTMTVKELKEVPASFGDSISALTALPGVIRTWGFFGPLVIRGGNYMGNNYFIDDIPIYSPMHFGGIHSVINNNLMKEIDLYASAFPAQFGSASSAVISINTVDEVQRFGGYADVGLISANALFQAPILKDANGSPFFGSPLTEIKKDEAQYAGYIIASGRIGYLSLFVPIIYKIITGEDIPSVPEYWDYQMKAKYSFNKHHSLTLLFFGSKDYITFIEDNQIKPSEGDDPLFMNFSTRLNNMAHSQGLYYTWQPLEEFTNKFTAYSALLQTYQYFNLPSEGVAPAWKDVHVTSNPSIFGFKDRFRFEPFKKHLEFRGGPEYTLYYFTASGKTLLPKKQNVSFDPADPSIFEPVILDEKITNHVAGGYLESKLMIAGLTFLPGIRSEYLARSGEVTWDPRGMLSYEFPTKTTLSAAAGKYSYFFQTNPFLFDNSPQIAKIGEKLESEKAIHRSAGIEQGFEMYAIKIEGFYNTFYDLAQAYPHYDSDGEYLAGLSSGRLLAYGFEVMLRKDLRENEDGLYGWINYTYTRSRFKSGLPAKNGYLGNPDNPLGDPYGDKWIDSQFEMQHAMKLVAGYQWGRHTLSGKFQYYTSLPYTPIVDAVEDPVYAALNPGNHRWVPLQGRPNSKRFPDDHRLDLRYSYKAIHTWGYVSWYIEIINIENLVYRYKTVDDEHWDYRYDYSKDNPKLWSGDEGLRFIPNFGVEVKF